MSGGLSIAFFGSSLVSAYWNGAATYYRGILRALAERGHNVTFYEPDAYDRQKHRDIPDPPWARVMVYEPTEQAAEAMLRHARSADVLVKASGVGVLDDFLEHGAIASRTVRNIVAFWDVDAPATLDHAASPAGSDFAKRAPHWDLVFTYGGGEPVIEAYRRLGTRVCVPIYNAADSDTHHPAAGDQRFQADLAFLGNRLADRERRVDEFFLAPASRLPSRSFLLGGNGWDDKPLPPNVRCVGHVYTADHNVFNCTPLAVLNISRQSMASYGFSPATRVFEAAAAGACIITDYWEGIEMFLEPSSEVLVARDGDEVAAVMEGLDRRRAAAIGQAARRRVLAEHTYSHRAAVVEAVLTGGRAVHA